MKRAAYTFAVILALVALYLVAWPIPIDPVAWEPPPAPGLTGPYAPNTLLADIELLVEVGPGPEDMTMAFEGLMYTGLQDGRIVRFDPDSDAPAETFVNTGGRPLGMEVGIDGRLIVADAFKGLLAIDADGNIEVLVDAIDGEPLLFVNDLSIAVGGTVWFTDSSRRFDQHDYMNDFLEARATGRLLRYDPRSGATTVALDGLRFPNGVATGDWGSYVYVAEMMEARIHELVVGIDGVIDSSVWVAGLPGYPDNLSWNRAGIIWVALPSLRVPAMERMAGRPWLRKVLFRVPGLASIPVEPYSFILGIDYTGEIAYNLQDPDGGYPKITSVKEFGEYLYVGSIDATALGRVRIPGR
jgi:sugar lactone lactonase YvrE